MRAAAEAPGDVRTVAAGALTAALSAEDGRVGLTVRHGASPVARIDLGLDVDGVQLARGAAIVGARRARVREEYTAYLGKAAGPRLVDHHVLTVDLRTGDTAWSVVVRAAADGVAFQYVLPDDAELLERESTAIVVPPASRAWVLEYQTWYETPRFGADLDALAPGDYGFPVLVRTPDDIHLLLSESAIDGRSSGAHAVYDGSALVVTTADDSTPVTRGHRTPWRVLIAGSADEVVRSTFVDDLAPAAARGATPPRPGRGAWSWWSSQYSGASFDVQRRFTDFAAEQGWEHVLVDCGWDASWIPELVAYASVRGIQVHLWSSWSDLDGEESLRKLALWRSWGVAGIKVDFMESESRERYRWYDAIIAETARLGLMVNFHGSVIPRGWARTHPHVVSYEAVRGAEYYVFYGQPLTARHNVILPFTRNVVGSMDYTPVTFGAPGRETTAGHELALGIVFESGITHFADDPDRYRERPPAAALLAELPATWDEVRLLDGDPDTHVVLARRSGSRWFVGGVSARDGATVLALDLGPLVEAPVDLWIVADADDDGLEVTSRAGATGRIEVPVAARGGFAAIVVPAGEEPLRARPRARLAPLRPDAVVVVLDGGSAHLPAAGAEELRVAPGWTAERVVDGWKVAPEGEPAPGDVAVFTLERAGHDGVPVVGHVRVVVPFTEGIHPVSRLPFLAAGNHVGPVERDLANGGGDPRDGGPLTVLGTTYSDGLGVSQDSVIDIALAASARRLTGSVAIDDETPQQAATAVVLLDGAEALRVDLRGSTPPTPIDLVVDGASILTLRTEAAADSGEAHVDWLALRLHT